MSLQTDGCHRCSVIFWLIWMFLYILYECAINIYFFYLELSSNNTQVFTAQLGVSKLPEKLLVGQVESVTELGIELFAVW